VITVAEPTDVTVLPIKIAAVIGPTPNNSVTVADDAATAAPIRLCDSFNWSSSRPMPARNADAQRPAHGHVYRPAHAKLPRTARFFAGSARRTTDERRQPRGVR
jgi:hypothetical protein